MIPDAVRAPQSARQVKLAERVARQITIDMRERGWPVGELLGTEIELIERYKVSRATLSEAVRQIEMQGAAIMQRGPRGGLVVAAPAREAIVKTIGSYLDFEHVSLHELFEAFQVIDAHSVMMAAHHASAEEITELRRMVAELDHAGTPQDFQRRLMAVRLAVADASGNMAIALFMRVLVRVLTHLVWRNTLPPRDFTPPMRSMRANIGDVVEAVAAGDGPRAQQIIRQYLGMRSSEIDRIIREQRKAVEARIAARAAGGAEGADPSAESSKAADRIARAIVDDIRHHDLRPGTKIGQEHELMERYGVSRWVIRQAIRMLEVHSVLRSKRGQGGGLAVAQPDPDYAVATAETYLSAIGMRPEPFADLWFSLLTNVAQLAAQRATRGSVQPLRDYMHLVEKLTFENMRAGIPNFYYLLADVARNKIFRLILMIISRYLDNFKVRVSGPKMPEDMIGLLHDVVEAVGENDEAAARELMLRYVHAMRNYVQFVPILTSQAEQRG